MTQRLAVDLAGVLIELTMAAGAGTDDGKSIKKKKMATAKGAGVAAGVATRSLSAAANKFKLAVDRAVKRVGSGPGTGTGARAGDGTGATGSSSSSLVQRWEAALERATRGSVVV
jgi:hypothetical protein